MSQARLHHARMDTKNTPPITATAGDTLAFNCYLPDYAASAWQLTFYLVGQSSRITINTTNNAGTFQASVPAATTAAWAAGEYEWQSRIDGNGQRYPIGAGRITILPDPATMQAQDTRTFNARMLAALQDALLKYAGGGQGVVANYTILGRSMTFRSMDEIQSQINEYQRRVNDEINAAARRNGQRVKSRQLKVSF